MYIAIIQCRKHVEVRDATSFRCRSVVICTHTHQTVLGPDTQRELTPLLKLPRVFDAVFLSSTTTAGESTGERETTSVALFTTLLSSAGITKMVPVIVSSFVSR